MCLITLGVEHDRVEELCSAPVLRTLDFGTPLILQTDASDCGIGAVLSQMDASGEEHHGLLQPETGTKGQ